MTGSFTFAARAASAPFALGDDARSWGDFWEDVARIVDGLAELAGTTSAADQRNDRAGNELMVACADRYLFAVTLVALWARGQTAALPPNTRRETVEALCVSRGIAAVLHDRNNDRNNDGNNEGHNDGPRTGVDAPASIDVRPWLTRMVRPRSELARTLGAALTFAASQPLVTVTTSGSTGAHVACTKTAGQILGEASLHVRALDLGPATRLLATVPPQHIYGLLFGVLVPLMGGGAFVRSTPHHAETIAATARECAANMICAVPVHLQGLATADAPTLPWRARIVSSGAPLPSETAQALATSQGRPVFELLGSSETGGIAWRERASGANDEDALAWRPLPGVEVTSDEDALMVVRSPFVNRFVEASVTGEQRHRGADRIKIFPDGRFLLLGRADGILKIGGSRVSVSEIEQRLRELPGITDAAVLAVDVASSRGHELWAVVAGRETTAGELSVARLRAHLLRSLEAVAIPRRFRVVDALPREATGKLTKERLRALFLSTSPTLPTSPALRALPTAGSAQSAQMVAPAAVAMTAATATAAAAPEVLVQSFSFPASSPYFRGHFDNFPLLPGVVQLNDLALRTARTRWPHLPRLTRVLGLKFKSPIRPGDDVTLEARLSPPAKVAFTLRRGAELVGQGTLVFSEREDA